MKRVNVIKAILKMYKWKLLTLALALAILLITKGNNIVGATNLPPGSVPTPNIDPL